MTSLQIRIVAINSGITDIMVDKKLIIGVNLRAFDEHGEQMVPDNFEDTLRCFFPGKKVGVASASCTLERFIYLKPGEEIERSFSLRDGVVSFEFPRVLGVYREGRGRREFVLEGREVVSLFDCKRVASIMCEYDTSMHFCVALRRYLVGPKEEVNRVISEICRGNVETRGTKRGEGMSEPTPDQSDQ